MKTAVESLPDERRRSSHVIAFERSYESLYVLHDQYFYNSWPMLRSQFAQRHWSLLDLGKRRACWRTETWNVKSKKFGFFRIIQSKPLQVYEQFLMLMSFPEEASNSTWTTFSVHIDVQFVIYSENSAYTKHCCTLYVNCGYLEHKYCSERSHINLSKVVRRYRDRKVNSFQAVICSWYWTMRSPSKTRHDRRSAQNCILRGLKRKRAKSPHVSKLWSSAQWSLGIHNHPFKTNGTVFA